MTKGYLGKGELIIDEYYVNEPSISIPTTMLIVVSGGTILIVFESLSLTADTDLFL